jgi:hypothetical protein
VYVCICARVSACITGLGVGVGVVVLPNMYVCLVIDNSYIYTEVVCVEN